MCVPYDVYLYTFCLHHIEMNDKTGNTKSGQTFSEDNKSRNVVFFTTKNEDRIIFKVIKSLCIE